MQILAASPPIQLTANGPGKAAEHAKSAWAPVPSLVTFSQLITGTILAVVAI